MMTTAMARKRVTLRSGRGMECPKCGGRILQKQSSWNRLGGIRARGRVCRNCGTEVVTMEQIDPKSVHMDTSDDTDLPDLD